MYKSTDIEIASCSASEELVAYLYDEMNVLERTAFESHLVGCDPCTAEFAELSFARLDVYEWNRDEFAKMATPRIVVPYGESRTQVSWLDAIRGFLSAPARFATAGGAFAVAAVAFGVWFIMPGTIEVASNVNTVSPVAERPVNNVQPPVTDEKPTAPQIAVANKLETDVRAVRTSVEKNVRPATPPRQVREQPKGAQPVQAQRQSAPRLNDFEDEDDNTLRLGDLLAEVDSRD